MSWQVLISISVVTYSVSVLLQRVLLREENSHPVAFSILFQLIIGTLIGIFTIVFYGIKFPSNLSTLWINIALCVVLYVFYNLYVYKALKELEASKFSIALSSRVLFTALASSVFLGESLKGTQIIGAALILFAVVLINFNEKPAAYAAGFGHISSSACPKSSSPCF